MAVSTSNAIRPPKGPARWETPYDPEQSPEDAARILATAPLGAMDPKSFPDNLPLEGLVRGDARLRRFRRGDVVIRAGEYGTSVFLLMSGRLRVALDAGFERAEVGVRAPRHRGLLGAFTVLFHGGGEPEAREESYLTDARVRGEGDAAAILPSGRAEGARRLWHRPDRARRNLRRDGGHEPDAAGCHRLRRGGQRGGRYPLARGARPAPGQSRFSRPYRPALPRARAHGPSRGGCPSSPISTTRRWPWWQRRRPSRATANSSGSGASSSSPDRGASQRVSAEPIIARAGERALRRG